MTILGWDMSHFDAPDIGDAASEVAFITHKAGGDSSDPEIGAWWATAQGHRDQLLLGAYWVLYPGVPVARANAFLARLDATCPGWRDGPFLLQLDCEKWNNSSATQPGVADVRACCDRLRAQMPKLTPIVYASAGQYGDTLKGLGYPLWNARYPSSAAASPASLYRSLGGDRGSGWAAYSGQTPAIWQFSSSATIAGQTSCDANAYRGTLAELTALAAPGWETDMPLTNDDITKVVAAIKAMDINPDPNVTSSLSGSLWTILARSAALNEMPSASDNAAAVLDALAAPAALAVPLAAALAPLLPSSGPTPAELQAALVAAFRELAGGAA